MDSTVNKINMPIFFLSLYIIFTFLPVLYKYVPVFGTIRIVFVAAICLFLSYITHSKEYINHYSWNNTIFKAWLFIMTVMVLGLMVSQDQGLTFAIIKTIAKYLLILAIMVKIVDSESRLDFIIKLYSLCGVIMAASITLNYKSGIFLNNSKRGLAIDSGIFADPNDLALFLNTVLPFLFYFYFKTKKKLFPLLAIILLELGVILTYSRGGFLGSCGVILGVTIFRKVERGRMLALILVGILLFVYCTPGDYKERLSTILVESKVDQQTGKYPGRMQTWFELLPQGMKRPFLGAGAGCSAYLSIKNDSNDWHSVHNTLLQVFLELGLLGFCSYLIIFLKPFFHYQKVKAYMIGNGMTCIIDRYQFVLISLIGFATTAFFIPQAYSPIIFLLSGITIIQYELTEKAITESKSNIIT